MRIDEDRVSQASRRRGTCASAFFALLVQAGGPSTAATLTVTVDDGSAPVVDAVVSLHSAAAVVAASAGEADLDQRDNQFTPQVLPITAGTRVRFPNSDRVRHHVYSFSPIKRFELPLYSGSPATPVQFDQAGVATLGCNIHDWMIAHVVVLDTPWFGKTGADGQTRIEAPAGDYRLRVWHQRLPTGSGPSERKFVLAAVGASERVSLQLADPPVQKAVDPRLRELQEKFRKLKRDP